MKNQTLSVVFICLSLAVPVLAEPSSLPPQEKAVRQRSWEFVQSGEASLKSGNYSDAEADFRSALDLWPGDVAADPGLAEALFAQGKKSEALKIYQNLFYQYPRNMNNVADDVKNRMHFTILLSQTGHWKEAVSVYEKALPDARLGNDPAVTMHFDPLVPMPNQLQASAHIVSGLEYIKHSKNEDAFVEFGKGIELAPDLPAANYYYGYGWQRLYREEQAQMLKTRPGLRESAKAALAKAAKMGTGDLQVKAKEALQELN